MSDFLEKITTRTWPLMTVAVLLIAGFMYWLYWESSRIESAGIAPDTAELPRVSPEAFAMDPGRFARKRVLLQPVQVVTKLGRASLALSLPGRPGYPAILDRPVLESELEIVGGDNLAIAGWVFALNDSILDVWSQRGLYEPENRGNLEGHDTFFLVDSLDFVVLEESQGSGPN